MFLQAAGHADVVDPQEAAAGEGDIPGGVQREHGLRTPLEAGGAGGTQQQPRQKGEAAGLFSHRLGAGGTAGKRCCRSTNRGTRQGLPLGERCRLPSLYAAARPSGPPPAWPPPLGSPGAGGPARPLLPTLPPVNPSPGPGALRPLSAPETRHPCQRRGGECCSQHPKPRPVPGKQAVLPSRNILTPGVCSKSSGLPLFFREWARNVREREKLFPFTKS